MKVILEFEASQEDIDIIITMIFRRALVEKVKVTTTKEVTHE